MLSLEQKINGDLTSKGKVYAEYLNIISGSLNTLLAATQDTRAGGSNTNAVLGAIDDISRTQLFRMNGANVVRYGTIGTTSIIDPLELKNGQLITIYVNANNPILDNVSVGGVAYSVTINGTIPSANPITTEAILIAFVDTTTQTLKVVGVNGAKQGSGVLQYDQVVLVQNASYTGPITIDASTKSTLLLIEQNTVAGSPKQITINTGTQDGSFVTLENLGNNEVVDTIINTNTAIKDVGSTFILNSVSFRILLFRENGELKSDVINTGSGGSLPQQLTTNAIDVINNPSGSTLTSVNVQTAIDDLDAKVEINKSTAASNANNIATLQTDVNNITAASLLRGSSPFVIEDITRCGRGGVILKIDGRLYSASAKSSTLTNLSSGNGIATATPVSLGLENAMEIEFPDEDLSVSKIIDFTKSSSTVLVLFDNGNLYAFGQNLNGQAGLGHVSPVPYPTLTATNVVSIYEDPSNSSYGADNTKSVILKTDGFLYACGYNAYGQLGDGTTVSKNVWTKVLNITANSVLNVWNKGTSHGQLFVELKDGRLLACGYNAYGQLGDGTTVSKSTLLDVTLPWKGVTAAAALSAGLTITSISASGAYYDVTITPTLGGIIAMLLSDGTGRTCGYNAQQQLGDGTNINRSTPFLLPQTGIRELHVYANLCTYMILNNNTLLTCGYNGHGNLGDGTITSKASFVQIDTNVTRVFVPEYNGHRNSYYIPLFYEVNGVGVKACGFNVYGQLGVVIGAPNELTPVPVKLPFGTRIKYISILDTTHDSGILSTIFVTDKDEIFVTGYTSGNAFLSYVSDNIQIPVRIALKHIKGK